VINATADNPRPRCALSAVAETPIVWGLEPKGVHDRFWAAHGFTIVRCGEGATVADERATCLLTPGEALILCEFPGRTLRDLKRRPHTRLLDLIDRADDVYRERVESDADGRFIRVRRRYHAEPDHPPRYRAVLTRDPAVARAWADADDADAALRAVRCVIGPGGLRNDRIVADLYDARSGDETQRYVNELQRGGAAWIDACPDLRRIDERIIAHVSAEIDPDARLIAPLWIGAGVRLGADDIAIGPHVIEDRIPVEPSTMRERAGKPVSPRLTTDGGMASKIHPRSRRGKRAFDIAFSLFALTLTAPLFPLIMLAIWIEDRRPFIFGQTRQTKDGVDFTCYKFRTMCRNAERMKAQLQQENICDGPQFHIAHDPRLLKVGKLLRRFHLDELPQFFNVLKGDMHVVGPRPSPDRENQFCPPWRETRLSVKPGMTGLWQVCRTRAPHTDFQEWIRYDLTYVDRENQAMDVWIIFQTLGSLILHRWKKKRIHPAQPRQAAEIVGCTVELKPARPAETDAPAVVDPGVTPDLTLDTMDPPPPAENEIRRAA
jgi:lipopolysaccharide/colanic/teichoic acid biosynthesis glycosyltransferase